MNIRQNIREFFAKHFSKHVWRERWLDIRAFPRKRVSAATLVEICECINPSYDRLVKYAERELEAFYGYGSGTDIGGFFKKSDLVNAFYDDREKFLDKSFLVRFLKFPGSFHEHLIEKYSPAKEMERFQSKVVAAELQEHILLSNVGEFKTINFVKIMVEDDIELNLGGKFCNWQFYRVKFCGAAKLNIYPPSAHFAFGGLHFNESACFGAFSCLFAGVVNFHILNSKFMSSMAMDIGTDAQLNAYGRIGDMNRKLYKWLGAPSITFFNNSFKEMLGLFSNSNTYKGALRFPTLGKVHFGKGNYIHTLDLTASTLYPKTEPMDENSINYNAERPIHVDDIKFDIHERIKMPWDSGTMLRFKDFFITLKNRAIEKRDREAEFSYARKERYFDRGLANRWQDKFILEWSHYVSDSGISWLRPIGWLLGVQAILAAAFIGWNDWTCACDWSWRVLADWGVWAEMFVKSLDPLSDVKFKCASTLSAAIYGVVRKIFLFLFLYETIKVFRRFSK